jgi:hypothetical protein
VSTAPQPEAEVAALAKMTFSVGTFFKEIKIMKPSRAGYVLIALGIFGFAIFTGFGTSSNSKSASIVSLPETKPVVAAFEAAPARTSLVITNNTKSVTQVFVVLAARGGACNADNPPITADQLKAAGFCNQVIENPVYKPYAGKCQFALAAGESKTFPNIPQTCISGNVTFGGYPTCPDATFPNGYTTAEFTLNPSVGAEDVDVSLVNGFNFKVTMTMQGGGGWVVSNTGQAITQIVPKPLGQNTGNPGVYPKDCTDCIRLVGSPVCPGFPGNPDCQPSRICDAQRDVSQSGGNVTITLQPN